MFERECVRVGESVSERDRECLSERESGRAKECV